MTRLTALALVIALLASCACVPMEASAKKPITPGLGQMFGEMPSSDIWCSWEERYNVEPTRGQYDFSGVLAVLDEAERRGVSVQYQILHHQSAYDSQMDTSYIDLTPPGYAPTIVLVEGSARASIPPYNDADWQAGTLAMIRAFGAACDGHPALESVVMAAGLDGETQVVKGIWHDVMVQQAGSIEYRWTEFVEDAAAAYAEAFPTTQAFINCAPGDRSKWAKLAYDHGLGLKHSGMWVDAENHQGYGVEVGSWDHIAAYTDVLPIWLESAHWGDAENCAWALFAGLHYYPDGMDLHSDFAQVPAEIRYWAAAHCGTTVNDTPSAWCVLRDAEHPLIDWTGSKGYAGYSGKMGNWRQYMTVDGGEVVWRDDLPAGQGDWRSRQCRVGDRYEIDVDDQLVRDAYTLRLIYLDDRAGVFTVGYGATIFTLDKHGSGEWVTLGIPLEGYTPSQNIILSGDSLYVHLVEVTGESDAAVSTPTATPTAKPTGTPTSTGTPTPTPTRTQAPSVTPTVCATNTPTATPAPTQTPWIVTATPEPTMNWAEHFDMARRLGAEQGIYFDDPRINWTWYTEEYSR